MSEVLDENGFEKEIENDDDTRLRYLIYERLGLEFGSLSSESGSDWARARDEILAEEKQAQIVAQSSDKTQEQEICDDEILLNYKLENEPKILEIINSKKLDNEILARLINLNKKDINIAIAREQNLSLENIEAMLANATFMAVKHILKKQNYKPLSDKVLVKMQANQTVYKDLLKEFGGLN